MKFLPKEGAEKVRIDDKVFLEYYKLEKGHETPIVLEGTEEGYRPITGESGKKEKKQDSLTVIIDTINKRFATNFSGMDKILMQVMDDYMHADNGKWESYAKNNDQSTFKLLFDADFANVATTRYEQNNEFFMTMFEKPEMMQAVMQQLGAILYERLRRK